MLSDDQTFLIGLKGQRLTECSEMIMWVVGESHWQSQRTKRRWQHCCWKAVKSDLVVSWEDLIPKGKIVLQTELVKYFNTHRAKFESLMANISDELALDSEGEFKIFLLSTSHGFTG